MESFITKWSARFALASLVLLILTLFTAVIASIWDANETMMKILSTIAVGLLAILISGILVSSNAATSHSRMICLPGCASHQSELALSPGG